MALERRNDRPDRSRGLLARADDLLLVGVIVVVALVAFQLVSAVIGTILFVVKLAVVVAVVGVVATLLARRRR